MTFLQLPTYLKSWEAGLQARYRCQGIGAWNFRITGARSWKTRWDFESKKENQFSRSSQRKKERKAPGSIFLNLGKLFLWRLIVFDPTFSVITQRCNNAAMSATSNGEDRIANPGWCGRWPFSNYLPILSLEQHFRLGINVKVLGRGTLEFQQR